MDQDVAKLDERSIKIGLKTNSVSDTTYLDIDWIPAIKNITWPGFMQ